MKSIIQRDSLRRNLRDYRETYLTTKNLNLDESATRIIVNHLLTDVLGYRELLEIKTEYPVMGGYIDYLVEVANKKQMVIEVKSMGTNLRFKHLRQAIYYALSVGVNLIILTNGQEVQVYKVVYKGRLIISHEFSVNLSYGDEINSKYLARISRQQIETIRQ
jgi:hypothetical protein